MNSAKLISVIVTESSRGTGLEEDPHRSVTQYWNHAGALLAEVDPIKYLEHQELTKAAQELCTALSSVPHLGVHPLTAVRVLEKALRNHTRTT